MDNINNNGYILLKNVLSKQQLETGLRSDNDGIINYQITREFIDQDFIPTISSNTHFMKKPTYFKFRYSNNNNSTDASTFHCDIYNFTDNEIMPIYTCLCYFDKTQLEVIPGSHKKSFRDYNSSIDAYQQKKIIDVEPGDILIFHANLFHRGTNFDTKGDRRLLQVFDVFPDDKTYQLYHDKFITVTTSNTVTINIINNLSYIISKLPMVIDAICFIHFILVYNDLQYKIALNDLAPWDKTNKLISYEPGKRINYELITGKDPINTNIICGDLNSRDPSYFYLFFYIIYWIVSLILIYYAGKILNKNGIFSSINKNILKKWKT